MGNKRIVEIIRLRAFVDYRRPLFFWVFSFLCGIAIPASGQRSARNAIYLELASKGPVFSLNYDRIIRQGDNLAYSLRGGFSIGNDALAFPVGLNVITGKEDHHAEFGVTIIPYFQYYDEQQAIDYTDKADKYIFVNPAVGYRFQKHERSVFLKAAIGPSVVLDPPAGDFWNMEPKVHFFGSIAAGISF